MKMTLFDRLKAQLASREWRCTPPETWIELTSDVSDVMASSIYTTADKMQVFDTYVLLATLKKDMPKELATSTQPFLFDTLRALNSRLLDDDWEKSTLIDSWISVLSCLARTRKMLTPGLSEAAAKEVAIAATLLYQVRRPPRNATDYATAHWNSLPTVLLLICHRRRPDVLDFQTFLALNLDYVACLAAATTTDETFSDEPLFPYIAASDLSAESALPVIEMGLRETVRSMSLHPSQSAMFDMLRREVDRVVDLAVRLHPGTSTGHREACSPRATEKEFPTMLVCVV